MRILRLRASWPAELGEIDLSPGSGMVGWAGGAYRDRGLFTDLLRWVLGLRAWGSAAPPDDAPVSHEAPGRAPDAAEMVVALGGKRHCLRIGSARDGAPEVLEQMGLSAEQLGLVWGGGGGGGAWIEPEAIWRAGARLLAERRGLDLLDAGVVRLGGSALRRRTGRGEPEGDEPGRPAAAGTELEDDVGAVEARLREMADVPERLRALEDELRALRADAAEATGDLEVATMDWLRERQDAETHLQQYRDQARQLRSRRERIEEEGEEGFCPVCGRPLEDHLAEVSAELRDEWERLVQDGSWWRRRRDQLELKPPRLQELEGRAVRLQAAVEESAERLERCRFELREWDELRGRREELVARAEGKRVAASTPVGKERVADARRRDPLLEAFRGARETLMDEERRRLADRAGALLNRISGGRILGFSVEEGRRLALLEDGRIVTGAAVEDRAAASLALHLALALQVVEVGVPLESILVDEPFRGMNPDARFRAVELLREIRGRIPQLLLLVGAEVVDAAPELFDHVLDLKRVGARRSLTRLPGGVGTLRIDTGK